MVLRYKLNDRRTRWVANFIREKSFIATNTRRNDEHAIALSREYQLRPNHTTYHRRILLENHYFLRRRSSVLVPLDGHRVPQIKSQHTVRALIDHGTRPAKFVIPPALPIQNLIARCTDQLMNIMPA